ncbi:MAG TPA: hypothetical protein VJU61_09945, partial [Polyangiaceae bacterium]|nr:hypothetical protein [Polyangiaceae bacterium]
MRNGCGLWCSALSFCVWICAAPARGAEDAAGYRAPSSCPDASRWRAALAARVSEDEARLLAQQVRVHITQHGSARYTGTLASTGSGSLEREVRGQTCVEVVEALALVAVLTRAVDTAPALPAAEDGWALTRAQELALAEAEPLPAPAPVQRRRLHWGLSAFTWFGAPSTPEPSLDYGLGVHGEWSGSAWQPWLMLGAYTGPPQRVRAPGGTAEARFRHFALQVVGCPWRFPRSAALALRPCLDLDVGQLSGEGIGVAGARRRSWPWLSAG